MSSEFMFDEPEPRCSVCDRVGSQCCGTDSVPDEHKVKRQQILLALRAMVFANNSGVFTREQQLVSMAISIEQTIAALEAELGEPDEEAVGEIALLMAQVAMRTG